MHINYKKIGAIVVSCTLAMTPFSSMAADEIQEPLATTEQELKNEATDPPATEELSEKEPESESKEEPSKEASGENAEDSKADVVIEEEKKEPVKLQECTIEIAKTVNYTGKALTPKLTVSYEGKNLKKGTDYTVVYRNNKNIGTAAAVLKGIGSYTGSVTAEFAIRLKTPSVKASSNYTSNKISWKKIPEASGYIVYRSTSLKGTYKAVKKYTSKSSVSYADTKASFGREYYYKVKAFRKETKKVTVKKKKVTQTTTYNSLSSTAVKSARKLDKAILSSAKAASDTSVKVTWKKVKGALGYQIYYSTQKDGTYKYGGKTTAASYTVKKLDTSKYYYYFKVKAYRTSGGVTYYGALSDAKKVTYRESTSDKRLKELFPNGVPTAKIEMEQYLVTITVPIKDDKGNASTLNLRVHKALASKFIKSFNELYKIDFPVRASDTDTYSWRSMASGKSRSHHSYGCVVDLNWDSNPMIGVTSGKYQPGKDPYSVTEDVVKIFKKNGFYWGGNWRSTKDYMHFTYTNH